MIGVRPMKEDGVIDGRACVVPCLPSAAEFFGLYGVDDDGLSTWIADYPTMAEALKAAKDGAA